MKKLLLALLIVCMFAGLSHSAVLAQGANIKDFALSTNVIGVYYSDTVAYAIYTGNTKGDQMYGSGSFVTAIYVDDTLTGDTFVSGDLPSSSVYTSAAFNISAADWAAK